MEDKLIVAAAAAMLMAGCATAPRAPVEPHPDTPAYSWKPLFADDLSDAEFEKGSWKLEGGVLRSGGKVLGFSVGEMTGRETFDVHFEKAEISINGAYPMVCRELARQVMAGHPGLRYINREEDMGMESLRRSKLSYKPEFLLKKYLARWVDET